MSNFCCKIWKIVGLLASMWWWVLSEVLLPTDGRKERRSSLPWSLHGSNTTHTFKRVTWDRVIIVINLLCSWVVGPRVQVFMTKAFVFQSFTYNNLRGTLWLSDPIKHDWNIEDGVEDMARIKGSNPLSPNVESSIEGSALELVSCKMAKERKSNSLLFHTVKILLRSRKHWKGRVLLYTDAMLTLMNYSG